MGDPVIVQCDRCGVDIDCTDWLDVASAASAIIVCPDTWDEETGMPIQCEEA